MKLLRLGLSGFFVIVALMLTTRWIRPGRRELPAAEAAPTAATCTWDGTNGNWTDLARWSCGLVPGAADTAIINGGTITVDAPTTIGTLLFGGVPTTTLTGPQPITVAVAMTWTGASVLHGTGLTTIDTNATLTVSRTGDFYGSAFSRPMLNGGTANMVSIGLSGGGLFTNTGTFNLGGIGAFGPLKFTNYGVVRNSDNNTDSGLGPDVQIFSALYNYGVIIAQDGNLNVAAVQNYPGGSVNLINGTLKCYITGHVGYSLILVGGTLSGNGAVECAVTNQGGVVAPGGNSPGTLLIDTGYIQQAGGSLDIQIGGPDLNGYDTLFVDNAATLNGTLNVTLINGYTPALFDGFAIVRYATHSGAFSAVNNPIAATHPLSYTANQVALGTPQPRPFQAGDLFVGAGHGKIKEFNADGELVAVLDSTTGSRESSGMCFDANGNLFATMFQAHAVSKFSPAGALITSTFGTGYTGFPESCVFDADGHLYVGQASGSGATPIQKRSITGTLLATYNAAVEDRGTDWIDLAADQRTLRYTSEGTKILAYDVVTPTQLTPFIAGGLPAPCYALRYRPNGEVLTACASAVFRFSPAGTVIMSYTADSLGEIVNGDAGLFAMTLDSDGTSFWTAGYASGRVHKVDIATGNVLKTFQAAPFTSIAGLTVYGEIQVGRPGLALIETVGTDPAACASTREITIPTTTTVTYCYRAINTGSITLTTHSLTDTVLGNIFTNNAISLAPGASTFVTRSATLHTTTINVATWSGNDGAGKQATTSDFTRVDGPAAPSHKLYLPLIRK